MRILVVEDEKSLNNIIVKRLAAERYSVDSCLDGLDAIDHLALAEYDAVVLDVMLPGADGFAVLKSLRGRKNRTPVLLLTARDAVEDRVKGLDAGADDYLVKPFAFDELLARIRVMVRRNGVVQDDRFELADLWIDFRTRSVLRAGVPITLTGKEFDVLEYLARNAGTVLTRERISQHLWNYDYEGGSNIIDVFIRYLRRKLDDGHEKKLIHTVRGVGYVLREEEK